jgi:hypothetical protein
MKQDWPPPGWENPPSPDTVRARALMADPGWQRCIVVLNACDKARSARYAARLAAEEAQRAADTAAARAAALAPQVAALAALKTALAASSTGAGAASSAGKQGVVAPEAKDEGGDGSAPRRLPRWKRGVLKPKYKDGE